MKRSCLLLLALVAACGDSITETGNRSVIMPLDVGNEWIGRLTHDGRDRQYDTVRIARDTMVADERWAILSSSRSQYLRADELTTGYPAYLINRADGLHAPGFDYFRNIESGKRMIKFPVALGDTAVDYGWTQQAFENGTQGDKFRVFGLVTDLDELIEVPAGRFHAFEVRIKAVTERGADTTGDLITVFVHDIAYFAPGVGLVKSIGSADTMNPERIWELYELTLR